MRDRMRFVVILLTNSLVALVATAIVEAPFVSIFQVHSINEVLLRTYVLHIAAACVLGYFVFRGFHSIPAKWVWLLGAGWLLYKSTLIVASEQMSLWSALSGVRCNFGLKVEGCNNWFQVTLPALHMLAYSFGAFLCATLGHKGTPSFVNAFLGRFKPVKYEQTGSNEKDDRLKPSGRKKG